jgi:Domain of unknown function (DUF4149)
VRTAALTAAVLLAARSTELWSVAAVKFAHLLAFGLLFGVNVWTTFVAGITMFRALPRQVFGKVQVRGVWRCSLYLDPQHPEPFAGCGEHRHGRTDGRCAVPCCDVLWPLATLLFLVTGPSCSR